MKQNIVYRLVISDLVTSLVTLSEWFTTALTRNLLGVLFRFRTMAVLFLSLIVLLASCQAKYLHEPLTKEAIDYINSAQEISWKADPDYAGYDVEHFKGLCGVPLDGKIPPRPIKLGLLSG